MARGINKVILIDAYLGGSSIPQISNDIGKSRSTVRYHLKNAGVLRSRSDGVRIAANQGRLGTGMLGKNRVFSEQHRINISKAKLKSSTKNAKGVSLKPNGYIEITKGDNKGRGQHRVVIESLIGRALLNNEVVHHIDGNRSNNHKTNLQIMTRSEHCRLHALENEPNRNRDTHGRYS